MATQRYPTQDAEARARGLIGVNIAGEASTIGRDAGQTLGKASRAKAVTSALGDSAPTLLQQYARWRAAQDAQTRKAAEDPEARAMRKSKKRLRRCLAEGMSPTAATVQAHAHYRKHGGRSALPVWARKVAGA